MSLLGHRESDSCDDPLLEAGIQPTDRHDPLRHLVEVRTLENWSMRTMQTSQSRTAPVVAIETRGGGLRADSSCFSPSEFGGRQAAGGLSRVVSQVHCHDDPFVVRSARRAVAARTHGMTASVARIGFWSAVLAMSATVTYDVVQMLQLTGMLQFPLDESLIFGSSLCIIGPFVLAMLALHYSTSDDHRYRTHAAIVFTTVYAVFASANYVVQLTTVIPAKLHGTLATVQVLEQTPHSLLWDFDALGYIAMGVALLLVVPTLGHSGVERGARAWCIANFIATGLACVVYFSPTFSGRLLLVGVPWGLTAPLSMLLIGVTIRRRANAAAQGFR